jgi:hypothetical protein
MAEFMIGTTEAGMVNLDALTVAVTEPRSEFLDYARIVAMLDGSMRGLGFAAASWVLAITTLEERNQLKVFCPGPSANVFIRTKKNDDTYADFSCVMNWPEKEERWMAGIKQNLIIMFTMLEPL